MAIVVNRLTRSVVYSPDGRKKSSGGSRRVREYNKPSNRKKKSIIQYMNFLYEKERKNTNAYFVTITTCQHKNGYSDRELYFKLHKWLKDRKYLYICSCERQRTTGDLHFHLFILSDKPFNFKKEEKRFARLFNVEPHPALFDAKKVTNIAKLASYITKYITKPAKEYSSLFFCRTFSIAGRITKEFKKQADKFILKIPSEILAYYPHMFVEKYFNDYCTVYEFSFDIWKVAQQYKSNYLLI